MRDQRTLIAAACAAPCVVFLAVYLPAAGHGFISDDFVWILHNRVRSVSDVFHVALNDNGFYRPAVALTFSATELVFGLHPRAFGLTNVLLALLCGAAVFQLCRALALPRGAALFASALWLLNLHGINMSILWISGRTALMATAAAAACAAAVLRRRYGIAALLLALAVTSREDATLLPAVMIVWLYILGGNSARPSPRPVGWFLLSGAIVIAYFAVRSTTNAMTPATAPAYYQFTTHPASLARNALEYADRTLTFTLATLLLLAAILRPGWQNVETRTRSIVICGAVWLAAFLAPALLLPVRSSLYACLPSVGPSIAAAAVASGWWSRATQLRRRHALFAAVVVPFLLLPVYYGRTDRWVGMAEFSARALAELGSATRGLPEDSDIQIVDDRTLRANMASVFSTMLRDAFLLDSGRYMTFYVDPPIPNADRLSGGIAGCGGCEDLRLAVVDGHLTR